MPRPSRKTLIVDDQPNIRRVVRVYLETVHKCEVIEASNGVEAIKQLLAATVDLIITDLVMPEMTGLELVGYVRRHQSLRMIPIVMLTSQDDESDRQKAVALGVNDYLIKPFAPLSMKPVIEKYL